MSDPAWEYEERFDGGGTGCGGILVDLKLFFRPLAPGVRVQEIVARVERCLEYFEPGQVFLNPDCGFGCFAQRCVNDEEVAVRKLARMAEAARLLRERYDRREREARP